ncbi:MAG: TonB-dependent receptor [Mariprofundaceae bacterium]
MMTYIQSIVLTFVWVIMFTASGMAAELSITIFQKGTGDPVEGATVMLKNNVVHGMSNEKGMVYFEFVEAVDANKFDDVKVLNPGYETLEQVIVGNQKHIEIYLEPNLVEFEGLEVVEDRIVEKTSKVVLSRLELRKAPGSMGDPIKVLQSLPGVVSAGGSGSGQVYMRGSDSQESIYQVNNLPVSYLYHWGGMNSVINPVLVSDFNVFLGGFPVEYGDFLGGAVDIKLRPPKKDRFHGSLHLGTYESSFLVEGPLGEADGDNSFYLAGRRSYIDLVFSPDTFANIAGNDTDNTFILLPQFNDMQALYRHDTSRGYLDIQYLSASDKMEMILNDAAITDPEAAGDLRIDVSSQTLGVNWKHQWSDLLNQHVTLGVTDSSEKFQIGSDSAGDPYFTDLEKREYFIRPTWQWQQSHHLAMFGLDAGWMDLPLELYISAPPSNVAPTPGGFTSESKYRVKHDLTAASTSPFIKYQYAWDNGIKASLGLRYTSLWVDQGEGARRVSMQGFSPRLSLEYQITESTLLLMRWGDYFQMPQGWQILDGFANPRLQFTRAEHRIVGVEHQLSHAWRIKAEAYHKPMSDLVVSIDGASPPDNYLNEGAGLAYGIDLFLKRKYKDRKMGWISYSWARSERTNLQTGVTSSFAGDQPHTLTAVWGQPFSGSWSDWEWGVKVQLHSGLPYTPVTGRVQEPDTGRWLPVYAAYNSGRLPVYGKLDLRLSKEVRYNTWTMSYIFDIQNISMRKNVAAYDYTDDFSNYNNPDIVSTDIFMPFFGIEADF